MYRTDFWTLWEKARVVCFERTALKHVCYLAWNRSPAQVGCMRQVLGPGVLGRPRGIRWRGRWEGGLGWGILVNPWLTHHNVWQNPLQYCKVISLQLIKINEKKMTSVRAFNIIFTSYKLVICSFQINTPHFYTFMSEVLLLKHFHLILCSCSVISDSLHGLQSPLSMGIF